MSVRDQIIQKAQELLALHGITLLASDNDLIIRAPNRALKWLDAEIPENRCPDCMARLLVRSIHETLSKNSQDLNDREN
jgi:hypothetical protein